ncbi:tripartite tricarboxylate transporter substrate binding protein [Belnapia sp. T6]|uniref:Tripartite tricarboxylate transporter substrate binding protein n=1 Tax=Belnapia mucosa TaxID=2804532 RepID=A0ABS1VDQ3_9PROT|nr:tripartite tricarboxylate transporter substrate binding protein [Belnapia mucosa]MBL6458869.1 tripartite tricarboxylate transporter substrate binding protein [Belnapia mucosa]
MRYFPSHSRRALALATASHAFGSTARAQPAWPDRAVRLVTPGGPGTSPDVAARLYAERLAARWGTPVTVENRAGADGTLAVEHLTQQRDGHALLFTFISALTVAPLLYARLPFDPAEIAPVSIGVFDWMAVVAPNSPALTNLAEVVAAIREQPGKLNWASAGGDPYLAMVGFVRQQNLDMQYVSYRSPVLALPDLTQGRLQLLMLPLAAVLPQARAGTLKLLAVTNPVRSPATPDVPTVTEAGFPDLTFQGTLGFFAPRSMPASLRERIAGDVRAVAGEPDFAEKVRPLGMVPRAGTPDELARVVDENSQHWAERARIYGVRPMH